MDSAIGSRAGIYQCTLGRVRNKIKMSNYDQQGTQQKDPNLEYIYNMYTYIILSSIRTRLSHYQSKISAHHSSNIYIRIIRLFSIIKLHSYNVK